MKKADMSPMGRGEIHPNAGERRELVRSPSRSITVNGRAHVVHTDSISHEQLVRLAFPDLRLGEDRGLTITFQGGPLQAAEGLLTRHQRTPLAEGETFAVSLTNAS